MIGTPNCGKGEPGQGASSGTPRRGLASGSSGEENGERRPRRRDLACLNEPGLRPTGRSHEMSVVPPTDARLTRSQQRDSTERGGVRRRDQPRSSSGGGGVRRANVVDDEGLRQAEGPTVRSTGTMRTRGLGACQNDASARFGVSPRRPHGATPESGRRRRAVIAAADDAGVISYGSFRPRPR